MAETINALVLAGGKSTRLGTDKVVLPFSGRTLLARMVELAGRHCARVWVSGREPGALGVDAPWLPDDEPGMGPLGGILTGLRHIGGPLLVLACDLPLLDDQTVRRLLAARAARPPQAVMTTFLQPATGYIEALVAVYEQGCAPLLAEAGARGLYKLSRAVPPGVRHHIPYSQQESGVFFNINYPADLAMLERVRATECAP